MDWQKVSPVTPGRRTKLAKDHSDAILSDGMPHSRQPVSFFLRYISFSTWRTSPCSLNSQILYDDGINEEPLYIPGARLIARVHALRKKNKKESRTGSLVRRFPVINMYKITAFFLFKLVPNDQRRNLMRRPLRSSCVSRRFVPR